MCLFQPLKGADYVIAMVKGGPNKFALKGADVGSDSGGLMTVSTPGKERDVPYNLAICLCFWVDS